ncbi:hypothetical protein PR048_020529, partial [Dryococelus australis]
MRVIEVSMEQRQNERVEETGDPRESPSADGIVRHDSHIRKSGVTRPEVRRSGAEQRRNEEGRGKEVPGENTSDTHTRLSSVRYVGGVRGLACYPGRGILVTDATPEPSLATRADIPLLVFFIDPARSLGASENVPEGGDRNFGRRESTRVRARLEGHPITGPRRRLSESLGTCPWRRRHWPRPLPEPPMDKLLVLETRTLSDWSVSCKMSIYSHSLQPQPPSKTPKPTTNPAYYARSLTAEHTHVSRDMFGERQQERSRSGQNPPTNGIVRHDSHMRKFRVTRLALVRGEQANRSTTVTPLYIYIGHPVSIVFHYLSSSPPTKANRVRFQEGPYAFSHSEMWRTLPLDGRLFSETTTTEDLPVPARARRIHTSGRNERQVSNSFGKKEGEKRMMQLRDWAGLAGQQLGDAGRLVQQVAAHNGGGCRRCFECSRRRRACTARRARAWQRHRQASTGGAERLAPREAARGSADCPRHCNAARAGRRTVPIRCSTQRVSCQSAPAAPAAARRGARPRDVGERVPCSPRSQPAAAADRRAPHTRGVWLRHWSGLRAPSGAPTAVRAHAPSHPEPPLPPTPVTNKPACEFAVLPHGFFH